jgi:hypothetical protein
MTATRATGIDRLAQAAMPSEFDGRLMGSEQRAGPGLSGLERRGADTGSRIAEPNLALQSHSRNVSSGLRIPVAVLEKRPDLRGVSAFRGGVLTKVQTRPVGEGMAGARKAG